MTDLDLDDVLAHAHDNCSVCEGTGVVRCWSPGGPCPDWQTVCESCGPCQQSDVPALVTALREARAATDNLTRSLMQVTDDAHRIATERDDARAERDYWRDNGAWQAEALRHRAERDDWRRRYEALRDGVLNMPPITDAYIDFGRQYQQALRAVVARVEGDES